MPNGETRLEPCELFMFQYYRGQSAFFKECKPSLYRKDMTDSKIFVERIKLKELESLIRKHPLTDIFRNGLSWCDPKGYYHPLSLAIDYAGLAQHYGIKTELIDLTNDKWVAAFFACTDYVNGEYVVHKAKNGEYGVFYYMYPREYLFMDNGHEIFRAIGQQPFPRPGEQSGFVLQMSPDQNFNDKADFAFFRHDDRVSELIFNYANRANKYFPYDVFQEKAQVIINSKSFSNSAIQSAIEEFYPNVEKSVIDSYIEAEGISSVDSPIVKFTEKELADFHKEWPKKEKEYLSKIIVRHTYTGPIEYVNGADIENEH
jgi:hypothetical protein